MSALHVLFVVFLCLLTVYACYAYVVFQVQRQRTPVSERRPKAGDDLVARGAFDHDVTQFLDTQNG